MHKELEPWQFIAERLARGESVALMVVAESSGSSPGRQGYKMAVGADGKLCGSVGGGVMEVSLVEQAKVRINKAKDKIGPSLTEQVHRKNVPNSSGMICSGKQTVIFKQLEREHRSSVKKIIDALLYRGSSKLTITGSEFAVEPAAVGTPSFRFEKITETDFIYSEKLGFKNDLYVIGGGHCALALSELMSRMDFHISIFDDRPDLNTIEKNSFANEIKVVESYERIADEIPSGPDIYVVVMTLGYTSDEIVIRQLLDKEFKYLGVLGSKAKMATLLRSLKTDGLDPEKIGRIHAPIGIPINSRTPEEIAVSIAAEIIAIKNARQ